MRYLRYPSRAIEAAIVAAASACLAGACSNAPSKEAQEAAKNTFACQLAGERLVIKFETGEARLLMPSGDTVILYQVPLESGVRYTNGTLDLRGKGMDMQLLRNGTAATLVDCKPYLPPA